MLARYFEYVNHAPAPALLWNERFGLFYHNALAAPLIAHSASRKSMLVCLERAAQERVAQACEIGSLRLVVVPLLESDGRVVTVLAVGGELSDLPCILHAVHAETRHFSQIVHLLPHIVLTARPNGRFDYASKRWFDVTAMPRLVKDMHLAILGGIDPRDVERFERDWYAGTRRLDTFSFEVRLTTIAGVRWHELRAVPNFYEGRLRKWIIELADIDEAMAMRQALLRSRGRLNALAETGRVLVDVTSSPSRLVEEIVHIAASALEATCIALYHDEDGDGSHVVAHPPEGQRLVSKLAELEVKSRDAFVIPMQACWEGEAPRPLLVASLGQGHPSNALFAIGVPDAQPFEDDDAALLGEMSKRLGLALCSAEAYRRERRVAQVLQRAMLPVALPRTPGISFDVTYRASDDIAVVGGDWYDAFEIAGGKIAVLIGDVAGHGLDAAVVMGCVREGIRTTALDGASPGEVLMRVNRTVLAGRNVMVTAFVGLLDPSTLVFQYANAGHPPPLVIAKAGISPLEFGDVALGVDLHAEYGTKVTKLAGAEALILFTDGLIEFSRDVLMGERRLRDALQRWADSGFTGGAEHLADATLGESLPRDDIALLVARFEQQPARLERVISSKHHEAQRSFSLESPHLSLPGLGVRV